MVKLKVIERFNVNGKQYEQNDEVTLDEAATWPDGSLGRIKHGFVEMIEIEEKGKKKQP